MSKLYALFSIGCLAISIAFYKTNAILSLFCLMIFIGCMYGAGKMG